MWEILIMQITRTQQSDKPWYGTHLDGTLARDDVNLPGWDIGEPVPQMVWQVKKWLAKGYHIKIFTARISFSVHGISGAEYVQENIRDWLEQVCGLPRLECKCVKDSWCLEI